MKKRRAGSALVACPVCGKLVPLPCVSMHLDTSCRPDAGLGSDKRRRNSLSGSVQLRSEAATAAPPSDEAPEGVVAAELPSPAAAEAAASAASPVPAAAVQQAAAPAAPSAAASERAGAAPDADAEAQEPADPPHTAPADRPAAEAGTQPRAAIARNPLSRLMQPALRQRLPGHFLFERFISEAEERALLDWLDACEPAWGMSSFNGPHRGKAWGVRMDLRQRTVSPPAHAMPPQLLGLAERMRALPPLRTFHPNEANANDYRPAEGMFLGPHVDDRQLSTGAIVTLSLLSAAVMTFQRDGQPGGPRTRVLLPPGSLQVLTRDARYSYTHAIDAADFRGARRVSVTFRQSPLRRP